MQGLSKVVLVSSVLLVLLTSCSGADTVAVTPTINQQKSSNSSESHRELWGFWQIQIDEQSLEVRITPMRSVDTHVNITNLIKPPACADCISFENVFFNSYSEILFATVNLHNPYNIAGYDVRGILYTDDQDRDLANADSYTPFFDIPGGLDINPFRAFATDEPDRKFGIGATHSSDYEIEMPSWAGGIKFAVTASYPGNCKEPYDISILLQEPLGDSSTFSGCLFVDVLDWDNDVSSVELKAPDFTGLDSVPFEKVDGTENTWMVEISNVNAFSVGPYEAEIEAKSENSGTDTLNHLIDIEISAPGSWYMPNAYDINIDGDYAYVARSKNVLDVYNVKNPEIPYLITSVYIESGQKINFAPEIVDGYAYASEYYEGNLITFDIDPPALTHVVDVLPLPSERRAFYAGGDRLYVPQGGTGAAIIDIFDRENPVIIEEGLFVTWGPVFGIWSSGGSSMNLLCGGPDPIQGYIVASVSDDEGEPVCEYDYTYEELPAPGFMFTNGGLAYCWAPVDNDHMRMYVHSLGGGCEPAGVYDIMEATQGAFSVGFYENRLIYPGGPLIKISQGSIGGVIETYETPFAAYGVDVRLYGNEYWAIAACYSEGLYGVHVDDK